MRNTPLPSSTVPALTVRDLADAARAWLDDGEARQLSRETLSGRAIVVEKLSWWLQQEEKTQCGKVELRQFFAYMGKDPGEGGRWGNPQLTEKASACTVATYHRRLKAFFAFIIEDGVWDLTVSPMADLKSPIFRPDQIQPFTESEVEALVTASGKTKNPRRDEALLRFFLDTAARVSEVSALSVSDLDFKQRKCRVLGKGNKHRTVHFGRRTNQALWRYLRERGEPEDFEPVFPSEGGNRPGERMTRSGILQLFERLGAAAQIQQARCSPHTCRHTFAINFLRAGGNMYALMEILGHTTLTMVKRYVALAEADIESQHRQFSPMDRMRR